MGYRNVVIVVICLYFSSFIPENVESKEKLKTGKPKPKPSPIIDGEKAGKEEFPYIVSISDSKMLPEFGLAGGVIVGSEWILTAYHVVRDIVGSGKAEILITPKYGNERKDLENQTRKRYHGKEYFCPPDTGFHKNDLALVRLKESIPLNQEPYKFEKIQIIEADKRLDDKQRLTIAGWGAQKMIHIFWPVGFPVVSDYLLKAEIEVRPDSVCYENFWFLYSAPGKFCASSKGQDSCMGDSGGPVVLRNGKSGDILVGIISSGSPLCK